jgi:predicted nucleic acid-binding protein
MKAYADSNFLVRLLYELPESGDAESLLAQLNAAGGLLPITWLHRAETVNALHLHVWQSRQPGQARVTYEQALAATEKFRSSVSEQAGLCSSRLVPAELEAKFEELALRHTAKHGFRTYDLLHVASALLLGCPLFWSFDQKANDLATREGLKLRSSRRLPHRTA